MTTNTAPGVYGRTIDLSTRVAPVSTSVGAIVAASTKGPVMQRTLVTDHVGLEQFGTADSSVSYLHYCAKEFLDVSSRLYVTRVVSTDTLTAGCYMTVDDITATEPVIKLTNFDDGTNNPLGRYDPLNTIGFDPSQAAIENTLLFFCAADPGTWNNQLAIRIRPSNPPFVPLGAPGHDVLKFYVDVYVDYQGPFNTPAESYLVTRHLELDANQNQIFIEEVINRKSKLIRVKNNPYAPELAILREAFEYLDGGTNGTRPTDNLINQGWELYRDREIVGANILINCGYSTPSVQRKMAEIAEARGDAIAILDLPSNKQELADAISYRRNELNLNTSFAALYGSDIKARDQYNDRLIYVPASGHIAAVYALTDEQAAVWFAPAGINRATLGIEGTRVRYNQGARDAMDEAQINPIRFIPTLSSYSVWGQMTLLPYPSHLQDVGVRRLVNFLYASLTSASQVHVFDPNDTILRARLKGAADAFLEPIKRGRGVSRYENVCDDRNNTPDSVANGDVILDVYIWPIRATKRIHIIATVNPIRTVLTVS